MQQNKQRKYSQMQQNYLKAFEDGEKVRTFEDAAKLSKKHSKKQQNYLKKHSKMQQNYSKSIRKCNKIIQ